MQYAQFAICAAFIIGVTVYMVTREKELARDPRLRIVAFVLFALGAALASWVCWSVTFAATPYAEADLALKQGSLDVTIPSGRIALRVHADMSDPLTRSGGVGHYTVQAKEGDTVLDNFDGTLDHHSETRRVMKRGVTNVEIKKLEGRHPLPSSYEGKHVTFTLISEDGALKGPVQAVVCDALPPDLYVFVIGLVLSLIGGVLDRRTKIGAKSYVGVGTALPTAFAMLVLRAEAPIEITHLVGIVLISLLLGAAGGGLCRQLVKPFVKPLPGVVPASGK